MAQPFMRMLLRAGDIPKNAAGEGRLPAKVLGGRRFPFIKESVTLKRPKEKGKFGKRHGDLTGTTMLGMVLQACNPNSVDAEAEFKASLDYIQGPYQAKNKTPSTVATMLSTTEAGTGLALCLESTSWSDCQGAMGTNKCLRKPDTNPKAAFPFLCLEF